MKISMKKVRSLFGAAFLALVSLPVSAGLMTYDDYDLWAADVSGNIITESFGNTIGNDFDITFDGGVNSIASAASTTSPNLLRNRVDGNSYAGSVGPASTDFSENITWTLFADPLALGTLGFFGNFRLVDTLLVEVGGSTLTVLPGPLGDREGGFGFRFTSDSDIPFLSLSWKVAGQDNDFFRIDEFSYVESVAAVPAPPALLLFGTGLLALIGFKRRKKAA
jgi:hypothetical protein